MDVSCTVLLILKISWELLKGRHDPQKHSWCLQNFFLNWYITLDHTNAWAVVVKDMEMYSLNFVLLSSPNIWCIRLFLPISWWVHIFVFDSLCWKWSVCGDGLVIFSSTTLKILGWLLVTDKCKVTLHPIGVGFQDNQITLLSLDM